MRLAAPGMLKLGPEGDDQQHRHMPGLIERQIQQLARGRVDPMRVLEHHQNGVASRHHFELMQQRLEQLLAFALRAEGEVGRGVRQRQQVGNQRDLIVRTSSGIEQSFKLDQLLFGRVVARQSRRRVRAAR